MEFLTALWLPILLSAVGVFIASFLTHMILPFHKGDWKGLPDEQAVVTGVGSTPAGRYMFPWGTMADMKNPEFVARQKQGPNGTLIVWPGPVNMGRNLLLTLVTYLVISVFIGYLCWHAVQPSGLNEFTAVFRLAGTAALLTYGLGIIPHIVWYRSHRLAPELFDGIMYAIVTGAIFAWLWPR